MDFPVFSFSDLTIRSFFFSVALLVSLITCGEHTLHTATNESK
jgi:hypothetical protein